LLYDSISHFVFYEKLCRNVVAQTYFSKIEFKSIYKQKRIYTNARKSLERFRFVRNFESDSEWRGNYITRILFSQHFNGLKEWHHALFWWDGLVSEVWAPFTLANILENYIHNSWKNEKMNVKVWMPYEVTLLLLAKFNNWYEFKKVNWYSIIVRKSMVRFSIPFVIWHLVKLKETEGRCFLYEN